jgi:hypothetical protein
LESVAATGGQKSNQSDVGVLKENFHLKRTKEKHFFKSLNFKKIFIRERITWKSASTQRSSEKKLLRFFSCLSLSKK